MYMHERFAGVLSCALLCVLLLKCSAISAPPKLDNDEHEPSLDKKTFIVEGCISIDVDTIGLKWEFSYADSGEYACRAQFYCPSDGRPDNLPILNVTFLNPFMAYSSHSGDDSLDARLDRYRSVKEKIEDSKHWQLHLVNCQQNNQIPDTVNTSIGNFLMVSDSACAGSGKWAGRVMVRAWAFVHGHELKVDYFDVRENYANAGTTMRELLRSIRPIK
ncbi:MAG: hypothetical protein IPO60_08315 [Flavobacteriales bacterium]|nr:hypothetical protein [Flavobacteriales bacterium]